MKESMEKNLYKKFLLLLNSKKQKIRELQKALNKAERKPIYDETTDESELDENKSDTEDNKVQETNIKSNNIRKRKANCRDEQKDGPKISKKDFMKCTNLFSSKSSSPEPSTSKDKSALQLKKLQNADVQNITETKQFFNTSQEQSEDDMFL
ncbi:hypothetical protein EAI_04039 [Harpegnathos saltator]|uniref:XRCC4 coiled-coil domain-containing protein n=2 Tax=Harpegnathos saltator TaxID=610380 RepID=E2B344_HARSA|nr:hypothetical protein EAI_04039 [Harpegnathos saltator]